MKIKISRIVFNLTAIITLSIHIILFIPLLAYGVLTKKKDLILYFPIFCSIIAITFTPPFDFDLYRHYEAYDYYCRYNDSFFSMKDLYLPSLNYLGCKFGFSHNFIYFTTVIIYYYIICYIIKETFTQPGWYVLKLILTLLLILTNNLVEVSGIRYAIALAFSSLYFMNVSKGNEKFSTYVFIALAILSHFSMIILVLIHILFKNTKELFNSKCSIILVTISLLIGLLFIKPLLELSILSFQDIIGISIGAETYTSGEWGADRLKIQGFNSTGIFVESFKLYYNIFVAWLSIVLFSITLPYKSSCYKLLVLCSCIIFLFTSFDTIYFRYQYFLIFLSVLLLYEQRLKLTNWSMIILLLLLLSRLTLQYALGFLSNYKLFLLDILSGAKLMKMGIILQLIN
ncbi:TPA: EpsG family protein [Providencia rettgeri]|nr:EpsG family protein [Providencia rettgeri]